MANKLQLYTNGYWIVIWCSNATHGCGESYRVFFTRSVHNLELWCHHSILMHRNYAYFYITRFHQLNVVMGCKLRTPVAESFFDVGSSGLRKLWDIDTKFVMWVSGEWGVVVGCYGVLNVSGDVKCYFYPPGTPWMTFGDNRSCITTDRMCPHRWQNLPNIRGRFCQMTHQHKIGYSVEISSDTTQQSIHNLKPLFLCNRPGKYQPVKRLMWRLTSEAW